MSRDTLGADGAPGGDGGAGLSTAASTVRLPPSALAMHTGFAEHNSATPMARSVGLTFPGVEVRWKDLEVEVDVPSHGPKVRCNIRRLVALPYGTANSALSRPHVTCPASCAAHCLPRAPCLTVRPAPLPSPPLPVCQAYTVMTAFLAGLEGIISPLKALVRRDPGAGRKARVVLNAGSGRLTPGRLCLLLGPPGAGKTTLLRVLAGQALPPAPGDVGRGAAGAAGRVTGGLRVRGGLQYNGLTPGSDFVVERCASYISQHDVHIGELTVEETLMFAAECLGPGLSRGEDACREDAVSRSQGLRSQEALGSAVAGGAACATVWLVVRSQMHSRPYRRGDGQP
jgi:hypothetical protein